MRRAFSLLIAAAAALGGCGGQPPDEQVRETVLTFSAAVSAHDYDKLCSDLFAPKLVESLNQIGLPCEIALKQGLGDVKDPRLVVGAITVNGNTATAEVRSSAAGQAPSQDKLKLVKVSGRWRIAELGAGAGAAPAASSTPTAR